MINPILSVCIRSYNQEKYIEQAIESVLHQKTTFDFEIIVSDDCSKDMTSEILKRYENHFPNIIKVILGTQNIGGPNNLRRVIEASSAKYLSILDADDYYTDIYKLQKQVDFLEQNPSFSACFHNTVNVTESGERVSLFNPIDFHTIHDAEEFISERWFVPVHSAVLRREYIDFPEWYDQVVNDDFVLHLSVVQHGPYFYMPDVMVAYRHHTDNTSHMYKDIIFTNTKLKDVLIGFRSIYPTEYKNIFDKRIAVCDTEIEFLKNEIKYPWRKWFRLKTFKWLIKNQLLQTNNRL